MNMAENKLCGVIENGGVQYSPVWGKAISTWGMDKAYERQMCPILWDTTGSHYDRSSCKMIDQELKANFQSVLEEP